MSHYRGRLGAVHGVPRGPIPMASCGHRDLAAAGETMMVARMSHECREGGRHGRAGCWDP